MNDILINSSIIETLLIDINNNLLSLTDTIAILAFIIVFGLGLLVGLVMMREWF